MAVRSNRELKNKIVKYLRESQKVVSADRLASVLHIKKRERARFLITLAGLEESGEVVRDKRGRYSAQKVKTVRARLMSLQRGYGFARPENGGADAFIPGRDLGEALPGDLVLITYNEGDSRGPDGKILKIIEKGGRLFTGKISKTKDDNLVVIPDAFIRYSLPIHKSKNITAKDGDKVRFKIKYTRHNELTARILTSYGSSDSARVCADAIVDAHGIPSVFPQDVIEKAENIAADGISAEDFNGRDDLRDWTIFTIDGADAKDLDDAVSLDAVNDGWRLGVHIADVSNYVRENMPLDIEARRRGTSVYFADRVIPMLPEAISNGICSLNAGEDKLAMSAILTLDKRGNCTGVSLRKTIIRSCVRGVYQEVNMLFDGSADEKITQKYERVLPTLNAMRELANKLREAAANRGTMDLISSESVFTLDENGSPVDISNRITGESEGIIEQFMISANVAVASFARKRGIPFVYRIHEQPDPEKLQVLSETAQRLGFKTIKFKSQLDLRKLMEEARNTKYARLVSDRLLRSMAKARYSDSPLGHYGLSLSDYCHFTSPIRRYPDLSIHRIITAFLSGMSKEEATRRYTTFAKESSELSSEYELRAMTAERECESCYKAEYMGRFIGEEFEGIISSVSPFGVFVELPNSIEGLVRIDSLPQTELRYDEVASYLDRHGRPVYTVGDTMKIKVISTDVSSGQIDFAPVLGMKS